MLASSLLLLALAVLVLAVHAADDTVTAVVHHTSTPISGPISPHFIGFSVETFGIHWWTDVYPAPTRPSFIRLMRQLEFTPYNASSYRLFRIGGISADTSYYDPNNSTLPPPPVTRPDWNYAVTESDIQGLDAAMRAIHGRYVLDINFRLPHNASYAVRHVAKVAELVGFDTVDAVEIGNEADDYRGNYRPGNYTYADYRDELAYYISELYKAVPSLPPRFFQVGSWAGSSWWANASDLLSSPSIHPYVKRMSVHSYPETHCNGHIATLRSLLSDHDSQGAATSYITTGLLAAVQRNGFPLIMGEGNSVSCHGEGGVSNTFAAALWSIDTALHMAAVGVQSVFWHHGVAEDFNLTAYSAFVWQNLTQDRPTVMPLYYGVRWVGEATAGYAQLLPVSLKTSNTMVKVWALMGGGGGGTGGKVVRVVVLHKDLNATGNATVSVVMQEAGVAGEGEVVRLTAKGGAGAVFGLDYAGQTWDGTADGEPVGTRVGERVAAVSGTFTFTVQPISAVMLTVRLTDGGRKGGVARE